MIKRTLVLWDIDGTLIVPHGVGGHAMERGFREQFHRDCDSSQIDWAGRTDSWNTSEVLRNSHLTVTT